MIISYLWCRVAAKWVRLMWANKIVRCCCCFFSVRIKNRTYIKTNNNKNKNKKIIIITITIIATATTTTTKNISKPSWKNRVDSLLFILCLRAQNSTAKLVRQNHDFFFNLFFFVVVAVVAAVVHFSNVLFLRRCCYCCLFAIAIAVAITILYRLYSVRCFFFIQSLAIHNISSDNFQQLKHFKWNKWNVLRKTHWWRRRRRR